MPDAIKPADLQRRQLAVEGWPVDITSYRLNEIWHAEAVSRDAGTTLARATGNSREEAESSAIAHAEKRLARTSRHAI